MKMIPNSSILIFALILNTLSLSSQNAELNKTLPIDPKLRIGKLSNGMTYYIQRNIKPEKRVELQLVVKAGSVLEDENQRGLAHFVEHMCFNGTKNFPKNDLVHYLQSIGANFGPEINGYTSFDETVYMLTIPSDSAKFLNKGIQIMNDWAHAVTFDSIEIEKERGVIMEEWRLGRGADQRMSDKYLPVMFNGSKYANRIPIGTKEIIEVASRETIMKFYRDWYRPELMAFIVVGDINPDSIEQKIIRDFGSIKPNKNPRRKESFPIPDNDKPLIASVSDKENPYMGVSIFFKKNIEDIKSELDYRREFLISLITGMLSDRLSDIKQQANPPFLDAVCDFDGLWTNTKNAFKLGALVSENGAERGLESLLEEARRVKIHGFTEVELNRYKKKMWSSIEKSFNEKDKNESNKLVTLYRRNFLENVAIPGIEYTYTFAQKHLNTMTLNEINDLAKSLITENNQIIIVQGIEKKEIKPLENKEIDALIIKVNTTQPTAYTENSISNILMEKKPLAGKIISTNQIDSIGITEIKLSNGVRVLLKPTNFKNDEIVLRAYSPGGYSIYPKEDFQSARNINGYISESGIALFSKSDLEKMLAGKIVKLNPVVENLSEGFIGNSSKKDIETMLQLTYLSFTQPRMDEIAFQSYINKAKAQVKNQLSDPVNFFFNETEKRKTDNHPLAPSILQSEDDLNKVRLDRIMAMYKDRFSDASDFTFTLVGSFSVDTIKTLLEIYLGSLPANNRKEYAKDVGIRAPKGIIDENIFKGKDPKTFVLLYTDMATTFNKQDLFLIKSLKNILDRIYIDKLREEMSGVYGFGVSMNLTKIPKSIAYFQVVIPCSPDNANKLTTAAIDEFKKIQKEGVSADQIQKEIELLKRGYEKNIMQNNYWVTQINDVVKMDDDYSHFTRYYQWIETITTDELQRIANTYFSFEHYIRMSLYPVGYELKK